MIFQYLFWIASACQPPMAGSVVSKAVEAPHLLKPAVEVRADYPGGSKALGRWMTKNFVFEKGQQKIFCYYDVAVSLSGEVTSVTQQEVCDFQVFDVDPDDRDAILIPVAEKVRACLMKSGPWIPALKEGVHVPSLVSMYLKVYPKKIMIYF